MLSQCWFVKELSCFVGDSAGAMHMSELWLGHLAAIRLLGKFDHETCYM